MTDSPTWISWKSMLSRCLNKNDPFFHKYGGAGVTVCERWMKFENFLADMGKRPDGKTIDRWPNKKGNYEPSNCRWATELEQQRNRTNNAVYTVRGKTACLSELAEYFGISPLTAFWRLSIGQSPEEAFCKPVRAKRKADYLTDEQVKEIRICYPNESRAELAIRFGVSYMAISNVVRNRSHKS